jgi:hypothetical protein
MRCVVLGLVLGAAWGFVGCTGGHHFGAGAGGDGGDAPTLESGGEDGGPPDANVAGAEPEVPVGGVGGAGGAGDAGGAAAGGAPDAVEDCKEDEFDAGAGCEPLTVCTESEFEESPPKPDQDRVCAPLTACAVTEYEKTPPSSTSNRVCEALTVCGAGTFVKAAANAGADRVCGPCPASTFSATLNASACSPWSQCEPGQTQSVAPSATTDRICSSCGAGKYESGGGCLPLTVCKNGEYEEVPPTATTDRKCKAVTTCVAGTRQTAAPTATTDRQCAPCSSGTFSSQNNATVCAAWTQCTAAQFQSQAPTAKQDRGCSSLTTCAAGTRIKTAATATSDRVCEACSTGTFTTTANQSNCESWTTCSAGYSAKAGSTTADRTCTVCPNGTFSTTENAAMCKAWTTCTANQTQTQAGTTTTDVVCVDKPVCSTAPDRTCTTACPCASGEGVCTASNQCVAGSSCVAGSGKKVGRAGNTCLATHCNNDVKDSGETSVDCGGECGCLATYEEISISGVPGGATFFRVDAMSGDGTRLAGRTVRGKTHTAAVITSSGALTELESYGTFAYPVAMSVDGSVVVGNMACSDPPNCTNLLAAIVRWTGAADPEVVSQLEGPKASSSSGAAIAGDYFNDVAGERRGYLISGLQTTYIPAFDAVSGLSPDGKVVAGSVRDSVQAGLWQASTQTMTKLGNLNWSSTFISAVNGQQVVATGYGTLAGKAVGFRWKAGTLTELGLLPSGTYCQPSAISADGGTVIGEADQGALQQAVIWTDAGNLRLLVDELKSRGMEPPVDLELRDTRFISNDGKVIVGLRPNPTNGFWRVTLK